MTTVALSCCSVIIRFYVQRPIVVYGGQVGKTQEIVHGKQSDHYAGEVEFDPQMYVNSIGNRRNWFRLQSLPITMNVT